ncbi:adenine phosphoribosyltransferase [Candidatus Sumerlaeota bacterium]|nr:adenine phosphoribosyltransferase [Candidatus Sumerlaeota bacterium]
MDDLAALIRDVPDFPKPGIVFKDITTLLRDPEGLRRTIDHFADHCREHHLTAVVGVESRGFIFGAALADRLGVGFVPVRKPGKLPAETLSESYELEYGTDSLEIHRDALTTGDRVVIIDDLLATGGTLQATVKLVRALGAEVAEVLCLIELAFLNGRAKLTDVPLHTVIVVDGE